MIRIRGIEKRFPGNRANSLNDLNLDIESGTFFTLFGPSGCGKSTLLRCIAGLETPDSGSIEISGSTVFSSTDHIVVSPNQRRIGMVFQSYAIWPHMTVLQNVSFPLEVQRKPDALKRARAALEVVDLGKLGDRYASKLSGGQQQRVALARAIVADPAVLLLDEPLSNLDAALRDQMRIELQALQKRTKLTTIYVTHDQTEALSMSDRIAVMSEGRFVEMGTPDELYYQPRSAFTARLIGGANIIDGMATPEGAGARISTPFGSLNSSDSASGRVQAFIRPDKVTPAHSGRAGDAAANSIICNVLEKRFGGEITEIDLAPSGAPPGTILRCRTATLVAKGLEGDVCFTIAPSDVRIFPVETN